MNCAEFQKLLPDIIEAGATGEEQAHLKSCPVCADLVADLKYIAEQAKLLVPMVDPSPQVWDGIQTSLEREGLVRPAGTGRFPGPVAVTARRWGSAPLFAIAAVILLAVGIIAYRDSRPQDKSTAEISNAAPNPASADLDEDDARLLQEVSQRSPSARAVYEDNLKSVNRYMADARRALQEDPSSREAHQHLIAASDEKAMLYKMALWRSLP